MSAGDSERLDKGKRLPFKHGWPDASFDAAALWPWRADYWTAWAGVEARIENPWQTQKLSKQGRYLLTFVGWLIGKDSVVC